MSRATASPKRGLWPVEAEFVVLWLDKGYSVREVGLAMQMTMPHVRCYLRSRTKTRTARLRLEQRVAFQRAA